MTYLYLFPLSRVATVNKLNLVQHSNEDLTRSSSDSGMESWRHRQGSGNNNSTVPQVRLQRKPTLYSCLNAPQPKIT